MRELYSKFRCYYKKQSFSYKGNRRSKSRMALYPSGEDDKCHFEGEARKISGNMEILRG